MQALHLSTFLLALCYRVLDLASFSLVYRYYDCQLMDLCKPVVDSVTQAMESIQTTEEEILYLAKKAAVEETTQTGDVIADAYVFPKGPMGTGLFQLYRSLHQFHKYTDDIFHVDTFIEDTFNRLSDDLLAPEKEKLKVNHFHAWFLTSFCHWLEISLLNAMTRIGKAISLDSLQTVGHYAKISWSAVDTVDVFYQVIAIVIIIIYLIYYSIGHYN